LVGTIPFAHDLRRGGRDFEQAQEDAVGQLLPACESIDSLAGGWSSRLGEVVNNAEDADYLGYPNGMGAEVRGGERRGNDLIMGDKSG
jgi:hypothetical protein